MTIPPKSEGLPYAVQPSESFACAHGTVISLKHRADSEAPSDVCMIHVRKALIKYDRPAVEAAGWQQKGKVECRSGRRAWVRKFTSRWESKSWSTTILHDFLRRTPVSLAHIHAHRHIHTDYASHEGEGSIARFIGLSIPDSRTGTEPRLPYSICAMSLQLRFAWKLQSLAETSPRATG